jgi:hypothetical protein
MLVIVTSKVGPGPLNSIAGNSPSLVVVKTNPGYGPDPSQPGTGSVVARVC